MGISYKTQQLIMPDALRVRYGNKIGNEIWFLTRVIKKDDESVIALLNAIDDIENEERRIECINAIWNSYYHGLAEQIIEKRN